MANSMMQFKRHSLGRERGFTLLEALLSLVLLTAGLLAAYRFNSTSIAYTAESNVRAYAFALAEGKLEELRNFQDGDEFDTLVADGADGAVNYASASLTRSWDRDEGFGNSDTLRKVEITVAWNDKLGDAQSVVLSSIIWRHNPGKGAKDLFLALNTDGNSIDDFVDSSGGVPGVHGEGQVDISEVYTDWDDNNTRSETIDPDKVRYYDVIFEGSILFTDQGLEEIDITMDALGADGLANVERISYCDVVEGQLHYTCYIFGIPDGDDWSGILDFDPAGNDRVCDPDTQSIDILPINQATTVIEGLEVVVMKNQGACP